MIDRKNPPFYHLSRHWIEVKSLEPLGDSASDLQDEIRNIEDRQERVKFAAALLSILDEPQYEIDNRFNETFGIDLRELPADVRKLLLCFALTIAVPGAEPFPRWFDAMDIGNYVGTWVGFALIQKGREEEGMAFLLDVISTMSLASENA